MLTHGLSRRSAQTDGVLVDIRKSSEVESKGTPALPKGQGGKLVRVEFDTITGASRARDWAA